jgi:hypothetical protein
MEESSRKIKVRCENGETYGFPPKYIPEDPDMAGLLNHPRTKELMLKYGEE